MSEKKILSGIAAQLYLRDPDHCPFCACTDIEAGAMQMDGTEPWQRHTCNVCGETWDDLYDLKGIGHEGSVHHYADSLEQRVPTCPHCGAHGERDVFDRAETDVEMKCDSCGKPYWCSAEDALIYSTTATSPAEEETL